MWRAAKVFVLARCLYRLYIPSVQALYTMSTDSLNPLCMASLHGLSVAPLGVLYPTTLSLYALDVRRSSLDAPQPDSIGFGVDVKPGQFVLQRDHRSDDDQGRCFGAGVSNPFRQIS